MIPTDHLLPFLLTSLLIILAPGPQLVFVVGRALAYGKRTAVTTAAGGNFGAYVQGVLVSLGLGTLVERSTLVFESIKLVGAAYLVFLGIKAFRHRRALSANLEASTEGGARRSVSSVRAAREGLLVGLTNPKVAVFFGAVLPQFVDRASGHVPLQMFVLATIFTLIGIVSDCTWGLVAGSARDWFARLPRRLAMVGGAGGLAMVGLGLGIAVTGRKD